MFNQIDVFGGVRPLVAAQHPAQRRALPVVPTDGDDSGGEPASDGGEDEGAAGGVEGMATQTRARTRTHTYTHTYTRTHTYTYFNTFLFVHCKILKEIMRNREGQKS